MSEDTKENLLVAAAQIFSEKGFADTTVREICDAAQCNLAGVNYHFGDKEKLYIEAVRLAHAHKIAQAPTADWPGDATPEEQLAGFIRTILTRMIGLEEAPWQTRLIMKEILHPSDACRSMIEDFIRPEFDLLTSILRELASHRVSEAELHQMTFSVIGQCLHYKLASEVVTLLIPEQEQESHFQLEALVAHITRFSLAAVKHLDATLISNSRTTSSIAGITE